MYYRPISYLPTGQSEPEPAAETVQSASVGVIVGVGLLVLFIGFVALSDRAR